MSPGRTDVELHQPHAFVIQRDVFPAGPPARHDKRHLGPRRDEGTVPRAARSCPAGVVDANYAHTGVPPRLECVGPMASVASTRSSVCEPSVGRDETSDSPRYPHRVPATAREWIVFVFGLGVVAVFIGLIVAGRVSTDAERIRSVSNPVAAAPHERAAVGAVTTSAVRSVRPSGLRDGRLS